VEKMSDPKEAAGTIVGGTVGFMVGGPAGAAVGAGMGSGADSSRAAGRAADTQASASLSAAELQSEAAVRAAEIESASADRSADLQMEMFREGQAATAPWRETGEKALGGLADIYGLGGKGGRERAMEAFQAGPAYQWQVDEAAKASDAAAAAGGRFYGGSQMQALQNLRQNRANLEFGNYTQGLQSLAGVGQSSAGQTAQQATAVGGNVGQTYLAAGQSAGQGVRGAGAASAQGVIGAGNAAAAGYINQANVISNMASQGMQAYGMYNQQNRGVA
jgi:hypothetical protein